MLKKIMIPVIALILFASCNTKTAFNYSQDLTKKEKSLEGNILKTETDVSTYYQQGQYDSVVAISDRMEDQVEKVLNDVATKPAPDVKGGPEFKKAAVNYFTYIKSIYTSYKALGKATTDEARSAELAKMVAIVQQKETVVQEMQTAQRKFASDNGFKVENKN